MVKILLSKTVLVLSFLIIALVIFSYYLGRNSTVNNSAQSPIIEQKIASNSAGIASLTPAINPFDRASIVPQSSDAALTIPQAEVEVREESGNKVYINNKYGFKFKFVSPLTLNGAVSDANFAQFLEKQGSGNAARMILQVFQNPGNLNLKK